MIYGIGTAFCDIRRMRQTLERGGGRFAERVLGPHEIEVFRARRVRVEARGVAYLATRFAAKEAFSKAIGLGMRMPMSWRAMQTVNAPSGKPIVVASGALKDFMDRNRLQAPVSITDETDYAVAFVIIEKT